MSLIALERRQTNMSERKKEDILFLYIFPQRLKVKNGLNEDFFSRHKKGPFFTRQMLKSPSVFFVNSLPGLLFCSKKMIRIRVLKRSKSGEREEILRHAIRSSKESLIEVGGGKRNFTSQWEKSRKRPPAAINQQLAQALSLLRVGHRQIQSFKRANKEMTQ